MENKINTELSIEVQDIIGRPPRALVRKGTSIIAAVFFALLAGLIIFKYPIIVSAPVILYTENPPVDVVGESNGRLDSIFAKNKMLVFENQIIATIKSNANTKDILELITFTENNHSIFSENILNYLPSTNLQLGELQDQYALFHFNLLRYHQLQAKNYFKDKNNLLQSKKNIQEDELRLSQHKLTIQKQELHLASIQLNRDSILFSQKVISALSLQKSKTFYLQKLQSNKQLQTELNNLKQVLNQNTTQNLDLNFDQYQHADKISYQLIIAYQTLKRLLSQWQKQHLLRAPVSGQLSFNRFWFENQFVKNGETVFTIIPQHSKKIVGRVLVPPLNSGYIKQGQQARIKLHNYPHLDFGTVSGTVSWVSEIPENGQYLVEINIDEFATNYKKNIKFRQEMTGIAEIITERKRAITQLIAPLRWIFSPDK